MDNQSGDERQNSIDEFGTSTGSKRISVYNTTKDKPFYIFEADFDKIKKIEVEPALLKFSKNDENKNKKKKFQQ